MCLLLTSKGGCQRELRVNTGLICRRWQTRSPRVAWNVESRDLKGRSASLLGLELATNRPNCTPLDLLVTLVTGINGWDVIWYAMSRNSAAAAAISVWETLNEAKEDLWGFSIYMLLLHTRWSDTRRGNRFRRVSCGSSSPSRIPRRSSRLVKGERIPVYGRAIGRGIWNETEFMHRCLRGISTPTKMFPESRNNRGELGEPVSGRKTIRSAVLRVNTPSEKLVQADSMLRGLRVFGNSIDHRSTR